MPKFANIKKIIKSFPYMLKISKRKKEDKSKKKYIKFVKVLKNVQSMKYISAWALLSYNNSMQ